MRFGQSGISWFMEIWRTSCATLTAAAALVGLWRLWHGT